MNIDQTLKKALELATELDAFDNKALQDDEIFADMLSRINAIPLLVTRIQLLKDLYEKQLQTEIKDDKWVWKAPTLTALSDCFLQNGWTAYSRRYSMLALMDEARLCSGKVNTDHLSFLQLTLNHGMAEKRVKSIAELAHTNLLKNTGDARFPEAMLLGLDESWKSPTVSINEANEFYLSNTYLNAQCDLLEKIRTDKEDGWAQKAGSLFERISAYILSIIPGVRTAGNIKVVGTDTDFDVLCSWEGLRLNFFQECSSYFVAECKCYGDPVAFSTIAKFARILDEVRCNLGLLFALNGITGEGKAADAEAEQQFLYLNRGICIVVITFDDIKTLMEGQNLFELLRQKYETVRVLKAARPQKR